jgi:CBS domain-containing protein
MRVREIMTEPAETVSPGVRLEEARDLMRGLRVHHLIVKEGARLVGVLSASDIADAFARGADDTLRVADVMSPHVASIDHNETVRRAANLMQGRSVGCLAVTRERALVGIITVSDLLRLLGKGGERREAPERASLHYRVPHRKQRGGSRW